MKKFYDVHMHAFDLSHPNLSAFIFNEDLLKSLWDWKFRAGLLLAPVFSFLPNRLLTGLIKKVGTKNPYVKNTLSFYDIPIEYQFLLLDYFLKYPDKEEDVVVEEDNRFTVEGEDFDKMVLCPLTIDFGYKNINEEGIFYNKAPFKPIAKQVGDLFYSIHTYYRFDLKMPEEKERNRADRLSGAKLKLEEIDKPLTDIKKEKLFEIYPFMGLNTQNYTMEELRGKPYTGLLEKYFRDFDKNDTASARAGRLYDKMGVFNGKMYEKDEEVYKNIFAGIKVYPQLGFDPYPDDKAEREKVEFVYDYCVEKRIPLMTHCSDGGFKVGNFDRETGPSGKWEKVLENFPALTVCFAHFGHQKSGKKTWEKAIIALVEKYENVYTDISCNDCSPEFYKQLRNNLGMYTGIRNKVLYGSDFSINMLASKIPSYNRYFHRFTENMHDMRQNLYVTNPENFLFGGSSDFNIG